MAKYTATDNNSQEWFRSPSTMVPVVAVIVIGLCGLSFYIGEQYARHQTPTVTTTSPSGYFRARGFTSRGQRRVVGMVTAITGTSITITNHLTNASQTYTITSGTNVTSAGQTASVADIQTGEQVSVRPNSTTPTQADQIVIVANPISPSPAPANNNS